MAKDTDISLRNEMIYCAYIRNHTKEGTFKSFMPDLKRIKALGTDILWLLPIYPIGSKNRKGDLGSPYAIEDYRKVNPEYGTMDDFKKLVQQAHNLGMKVMIDIVYNHTSPDSVLVKEHEEWFMHDKNGLLQNKVSDWSDISDLDYRQKALWQYQIDTLKQWAKIVDGFRCDVAPLVPIDFWIEARKQVEEVHPGMIWLAESTGDGFIRELRNQGYWVSADGEMYEAFDITYDYDISDEYRGYLAGLLPLDVFVKALNHQDVLYPHNYVKMHFLENHDNERAHKLIPNKNDLINWTAFSMFEKGIALIYGGQEFGDKNTPSLFTKDLVQKDDNIDLSELITAMSSIKKHEIVKDGAYFVENVGNDIVKISYTQGEHQMIGIFSLKSQDGAVPVSFKDGNYDNLITGEPVHVTNEIIKCVGQPIIISK